MVKRLFGWAALIATLGSVLLFAVPSCQGTCETSDQCGGSDFCAIQNGSCLTSQTVGFCKSRPKECPNISAAVCGCDGKTYENACLASQAGQSVASTGPCPSSCGSGSCVCGGPSGVQCAAGFYCDYGPAAAGSTTAPPTCLTPGAFGTCIAVPQNCTQVNQPVCGCDGKTYQNACLAAAASTSVASTGACTCNGATCNQDEFCNQAQGTCGQPNPAGNCQKPPADCKGVAISPVCGCDNKTYDNACEAAKVRVSVASVGSCVCGGPLGITCEAGWYCQLAAGACLIPGSPGTCQKIPAKASCPVNKQGNGFCGCKNKTTVYDNACLAAADGDNTSISVPMMGGNCP